jgi:hypothetical protein
MCGRGIYHDADVGGGVWMDQCGCRTEGRFRGDEGGNHVGGPQDDAGPLHAALQRVCEREQGSCQAWQKSAIKVNHSKETLKTLDCCWLREVLDGGDVALQGAGSLCCDAMPQEVDGGLCKRTFFNVKH